MTRTGAAALVAALFLLSAGPAGGAAPPPEPPGYRMDAYRAPGPATLAGARVVSTAEAHRLWQEKGAVFIDVLPRPPKPDLPAGTVWREQPRFGIPGSIWLPDVGYGALSPEMERYYRENLARATSGDPGRTIVIYCLAECWMSWNAARRALEWGYGDVVWYPDGTDGWSFEGHPTEEYAPVPRPGEAVSR